jgi:iron(III) transport system substrate-binding protein
MNGKLFRTGSPGGRVRALRALVSMLTVAGVVLLSASAGSAGRTAAPPPPTKKQLHDASAKLVAAARKVGTLNFYTSADQVTAQKLADAFGKKYGIKVTFTRLTSGPIAARYTAEAQSGNTAADVVMIADAPFFANALSQKWMMPINPTTVPNVATIAKKFRFYGSAGIGISRLDGVVINTNAVKGGDVPKTWKDLTSSRFKGRLLAGDPRTVPVNMGLWKVLRATYGDDFVKAMGGQNIQWVASLVSGVQTVAAGERDAAMGANPLHMNPLLASAPTAPVQLLHMTGPDVGFVWNAGVSTKSPNPAAGQLFVTWLLSGQGQILFNGPGNNSVLPAVTIAGSAPITDKFITLATNVSADKQQQILSLLGLT